MSFTTLTKKHGCVYELIDPRDNSCRYIGVTFNADQRYKQHCNCTVFQGNAQMLRWKHELESVGLKPTMNILESPIDAEVLLDREVEWCRTRANEGCDLLNRPVGKIKRADLFPRVDSEIAREFAQESVMLLEEVWRRYGNEMPSNSFRLLDKAIQQIRNFRYSLPELL